MKYAHSSYISSVQSLLPKNILLRTYFTLCLLSRYWPPYCGGSYLAKPWQFSLAVCYYSAQQFCLGLLNPYISSALWRQRKSKNTAHFIPILLRGLGEAVVTNDWCIIYSLWCTSHEHLVLSHPKNILTPNTKYDICWYIVQPISKQIPTPSLVSLSDLSIIFIARVFFHLNHTWGVSPVIIYLITYSCPELRFGMHVLHCLVSTNQYLE